MRPGIYAAIIAIALLAGCGAISVGVSNSPDYCPDSQNIPCR